MGIFELFKRKGIEDDGSGMSILYQSRGLKPKEESWGKADYLTAYETALYLNKALNKRAEKVAQVQFVLRKGDEVIDNHEILDLLAKPNEFHTGRQFIALYQKYKDVFGEVFVLMAKKPEFMGKGKVNALYVLNPQYMTRLTDKSGTIVGYEYKTTAGTTKYLPEEIIYDFYADLRNPTLGESLIKAGAKTVSIERQLSDYQVSILRNGGKVDGILSFKGENLSKTQLAEMKDSYKDNYAEATKSGTPLFLGGDATYTRVTLGPEELSYNESRKMSLNDVCILTGVPKSMLGVFDDIKYDNADNALRVFLRETIKPLVDSLVEKFNENLILVPEPFELGAVDFIPEDVDLKLRIIDSGIKNYYLTINEAREAMGYEPIPDGDTLLVPFSVSPLSVAVEEPVEEEPVKEEPKEEPVEDEEEDEEEDEKPEEDKEKSIKSKFKHPLRSFNNRVKYYRQFIKRSDKNEARLRKALRTYLSGQKKRIIASFGKPLVLTYSKSQVDDIFNQQVELKIGMKELIPLLEKFYIESGELAREIGGNGKPFVLTSDAKSWINNKAEIFLKQINKTTYNQLKVRFAESMANNESYIDLSKRITDLYGDISKGRANTIARTEVNGYMNKGTIDGYKQAMIPIKIWVAVLDTNTRDSHAEMDGQEVPVDMPFSNGLMYPGDPSGDASETINCRCAI